MALKEIPGAPQQECSDTVRVFQIPHTEPKRGTKTPRNHAELLLACGFSCPEDLACRLKAWRHMLAGQRPDVVICDHAPTALLATRLAGLPSILVGNGFAIPADLHPWPAYRPWTKVSLFDLLQAEEQLDQCVAQALRLLGHPADTATMRELYQQPAILDTLPELDLTPHRDGHCIYVGPITDLPSDAHVHWSDDKRAKILGYLHPETPHLTTLLKALSGLVAEVHLVIPGGLGADKRQGHSRSGLTIHTTPLNLPSLLPKTTLAISNGNSGFSTQCLLAGIPMLMYPRHAEQGLTSMAIEQLGAGLMARQALSPDDTLELLNHLMTRPSFRAKAQDLAKRHVTLGGEQALKQAVRFILQAVP